MRIGLRLGILLLLALFLLELLYRYQVVDSYRREWNHLNPNLSTENAKQGSQSRVLVMGDSFTAAPENWVDRLRTLRPDLHIFNSAVPGTGIRQANFMARRRFKTTTPQRFIYQIYVGNDLFDLRFPLNWGEIGFMRNLYWMLANRFRSLGWANYALGQFGAAPPEPGTLDGKTVEAPFMVERYSPRARLYLQAEPTLVEQSVRLQGDRKKDFADYLDYLDELVEYCPAGECEVLLLVIPHCAQVVPRYLIQAQDLGAVIADGQGLLKEQYEFYTRLEEHFAGDAHVQLLNALPELRTLEQAGTRTYYNNDIHLSPAGQQVIADLVAKQLLTD